MARRGTGRATRSKVSPGQRKNKSRSTKGYLTKRLNVKSPGTSPRQRSTRRGWDTSDRSFDARTRALHAISKARREGISLSEAVAAEETTIETVRKYLPAALRQSKSGRWSVTPKDDYVRYLLLPGRNGLVSVRIRGSEEAKLASAYLQSVARWIKTEQPYELASFHGKKIGDFELVTAASSLRAMRDAGLLQLDLLYAALKDVA